MWGRGATYTSFPFTKVPFWYVVMSHRHIWPQNQLGVHWAFAQPFQDKALMWVWVKIKPPGIDSWTAGFSLFHLPRQAILGARVFGSIYAGSILGLPYF